MNIRDKATTVLTAFSITFLYVTAFTFLTQLLMNGEIVPITKPVPSNPLYFFFSACILAPTFEEAIFRWAPLTAIRKYQHLNLPVIVISSFIFGLMHGSFYNVFIQGVIGVIASYVYLKNNYCYWSAVSYHALWNLVCLAMYYY
jgi:membrane protease YdiL (CAAX protease family)